jgi:putative ABC transport system permease protein
MTLFGTQAAVGRRFGLEGGYDFLVTAVVADVPGPSHLGQSILERFDGGFDILIRYDFNLPTQPLDPRSIGQPEFWFGWDVLTHVLLPENGTLTPDMLSERLQSLVDRSLSPDIGLAKFDVRPVSEFVIWRLNQMVFGARTSIRITHVIFSLSCSILVLGLLTYVNLSTAQLRSRARTIAVRQVSGASRGRIAAYLLSEVAIASTLALLASVLLLVLITPAINSKLHSLISIPFGSASFWVFMLVLMVVVFCIAGVYPAVASARSSPSAILRASCSPDSSGALRMLLVGIQFSLASALFAAVVVVSQQNAELRRATSLPGPDRYVVIASDLDDAGLELEELGNALTGQPAILGFTGLGTFPWRI